MALTKRQKQVLDFVADYIDEHGYSPSYEELARGLQLASLATVHKHIEALEGRKYLRRSFNQSRSLEVASSYRAERMRERVARTPEVPLLGTIAAGFPVEAVAEEENLAFGDFAGKEGVYALKVRGDSMIDDHICSGDYVLVEQTDRVADGEIVVALVSGSETTLKRFYRQPDGSVRLQPANSAIDPIVVPAESVQIQGRVLAVLRKYK